MLLQAEIAGEVIKNSFNTNPDTVFGVLVSMLILAIIGLAYVVWKKDKSHIETVDLLHREHKDEMKTIFERHEAADTEKYKDMKELGEKVMTGMTKMTTMIEELIRNRQNG